MKTFPDYLTAYKLARGFRSDVELARHLRCGSSYISQMRRAGNATDEFCIELAETIGEDPAIVMISRNALKNTGRVGEVWKNYLGKVGAVAMLGIALSAQSGDAFAGENAQKISNIPPLKITGNMKLIKLLRKLLEKARQLRTSYLQSQQSTVKPWPTTQSINVN